MSHWPEYTPVIGRLSATALAGSVAGAAYVTLQQADLILLFAFLIFMSGRFIQGAITVRLFQKIVDFIQENTSYGSSSNPRKNASQTDVIDVIKRGASYIGSKFRDYVVILLATGTITIHTTMSIAAVYLLGSGSTIEAIERFWTGFFLLTAVGLAFDFRHFAHRLSWIAAFGMVLATSGAFLYSPVGFSTFTAALAPYLNNPIPDWMRWPLGVAGFVFGIIFWAIFYSKKN
jgi:hypothetical protein